MVNSEHNFTMPVNKNLRKYQVILDSYINSTLKEINYDNFFFISFIMLNLFFYYVFVLFFWFFGYYYVFIDLFYLWIEQPVMIKVRCYQMSNLDKYLITLWRRIINKLKMSCVIYTILEDIF